MIINNVKRKTDILIGLPMCDCGQPYLFLANVYKILRAIRDHVESNDYSPEQAKRHRAKLTELCGEDTAPGFWCWMYWLESADLTEHAGCVSSSWLTTSGEELLELFECLDKGIESEWARELEWVSNNV